MSPILSPRPASSGRPVNPPSENVDILEGMEKRAWTYQRKGIPGWWAGWYEAGRRKAKGGFPNRALADRYAETKRKQINAGVSTEIIAVDWPELVAEYRQSKDAADGLRESSLYDITLTLRHFARLIGPVRSTQITQTLVERFIKARENDPPVRGKQKRESNGKRLSLSTLNKDIRNVKTFLRWCADRCYVSADAKFRFKSRRVQQAPVTALSPDQVRSLLDAAAQESPTWRLRVLLAVATGLRRGDIESRKITDIHFDRAVISTQSRKTGKALERPIPREILAELARYVAALPADQKRFFPDTFIRKRWEKIRERAGLPELKFHDLRKTFASALAQRGVSTAVTQKLLEHATAQLTNDVYTNVDPVLRDAINRLPMAEWLSQPIPPIPKVPPPDET